MVQRINQPLATQCLYDRLIVGFVHNKRNKEHYHFILNILFLHYV